MRLKEEPLVNSIVSSPKVGNDVFSTQKQNTLVIEPSSGMRLIDWSDLWRYRDLLRFLVWRDIKTVYVQSVFGIGWVVIKPLTQMLIFTFLFGGLARFDSEGVPYAIFSYTALVPWTYFSSAFSGASLSLVSYAGIINKIYFPRLMLPLTSILSRLVDFLIAMLLLIVLMIFYHVVPTIWAFTLPLMIVMMMLASAGVGMFLAALAVQFRDVGSAINAFMSLLLYAAPIVYPTSMIPERFHLLYSINPMVGVIEGFRSALLSTNPMPWSLIAVSGFSSIVIFIIGLLFFQYREDVFADVA